MREVFIEKNFSAKHEAIIEIADAVMVKARQDGFDLSLRSIYYQFVAHHGLGNTELNYKMLGGVITDARDAGRLDWDLMGDKGRKTVEWATYDDPADLIASSRWQYSVKMWENQEWYVELMVEKEALSGVLQPVAARMQVPFSSNKGYSSSSALYRAGKRLESAFEDGKQLAVVYLGDHDPSGIDMSRDVRDRLQLYSRCDVEVTRAALNIDQVRRYNPPPNPTKLTDSRAEGYIAEFGMDCWELDALDYGVMADLATQAIRKYVDQDQWAADTERYKADLSKIDVLIQKYRDGDLDSLLSDGGEE